MRCDRLVSKAALVLLGALTGPGLAGAAPAWAAPSPGPAASSAPAGAAPGQPVCTINQDGVVGISGMVARADGYVVVNDSQQDADPKIYFFAADCKAKGRGVAYPNGAFDPEDLAMGRDGTLWIADIGDNTKLTGGSGKRRSSIALWTLATATSSTPVIHRFAYPDGPHDAEALLVGNDGVPIIITKETDKPGTPAKLFKPSAPIASNNATGVPLAQVGEFKIPETDTVNPYGPLGRGMVTGGATSADGKRVALRTYADAFEWDAPDGDLVKAITTGKPRITPLPNETHGESITYSADGASFLTVSDVEGSGNTAVPILRYAPKTAAAAPKASENAAPADTRSWRDRMTVQDWMYLVAGVGVLGMILVVVGLVGIRSSRNRRRTSAAAEPASPPVPSSSPATYRSGAGSGDRSGEPGGGRLGYAQSGGGSDGWAVYDDDSPSGAVGHAAPRSRSDGAAGRRGGGTVYGGQPSGRSSVPDYDDHDRDRGRGRSRERRDPQDGGYGRRPRGDW